MRASRVAALFLVAVLGCSSDPSGDGDSDDDASSASTEGAGAGSSTGASSASTGSSGGAPLSDGERYLLGVWRGLISEDGEYQYFVLEEGRNGCAWVRDGDNFGQRFFEVQFTEWRLEPEELDADGRMTIHLTVDGVEQTIDRYDAENDHIYVAELQQTTWQSVIVPCSGAGSNSTAVDVPRQGSPP
jgi:hypothetical protein